MAILANTRYEWVLADLGINCAGAATTTVYPTTEPEDAELHRGQLGLEGADRGEPEAGAQDRRRHRPA